MPNHEQNKQSPALRELTPAEMQQAGGEGKLPSGVKIRIPITVKHNL